MSMAPGGRWLPGALPKLADLLDGAEEVLTYLSFPHEHWRQLWSTNPLKRLNKELKRRTNVVGIVPNDDAVLCLVGAILLEQHDEWQVGRHSFSAESLAKLTPNREEVTLPVLVAG